jgi:hypothetical protein
MSRTSLLLVPALALTVTVSAAATPQTGEPVFCGAPDFSELTGVLNLGNPSDCAMNSNTAGSAYDPSFIMEIPVVWHVITQTGGFGNVTDAAIANQMVLINKHYGGTLGSQGNNAKIRFVMASIDPTGAATTGITRTANNTWFNDSTSGYTSLTWDSTSYLNIFTLNPIGGAAVGYVTNLPQGGIVGTPDDAVRMLHSAIDSSTYPHVTSHEIGHHFGLWHTFQGGCAGGSCQTVGDLICDTPSHGSPTWNCGSNSAHCGSGVVPNNNFMNYLDAPCVWEFTPGQIQRMRCTLINWRPSLFTIPPPIGTGYCSATPNSTGIAAKIKASGSTSVAANNVNLTANPVPNAFGLFFYGALQGNTPLGNGTLCMSGSLNRLATHIASLQCLSHDLDVNNPSAGGPAILAGSTWNFQAWFRDTTAGGALFDLSNGLEIVFTP